MRTPVENRYVPRYAASEEKHRFEGAETVVDITDHPGVQILLDKDQKVTGVLIDEDRVILRGLVNWVPLSHAITKLARKDAAKGAISDRIERAREELRKAQAELEALKS